MKNGECSSIRVIDVTISNECVGGVMDDEFFQFKVWDILESIKGLDFASRFFRGVCESWSYWLMNISL